MGGGVLSLKSINRGRKEGGVGTGARPSLVELMWSIPDIQYYTCVTVYLTIYFSISHHVLTL